MSTSARMLSLLSLLQTHRYWPGDELAARLEVSGRTLRRDIERLRDLGYQVDASRGVAGGYQLRAGGQLPPLLLEDDEAVAIAVGLRTAAASVPASAGSRRPRCRRSPRSIGADAAPAAPPDGRRRPRRPTPPGRGRRAPPSTPASSPPSPRPAATTSPSTSATRRATPTPTERWVEPHRLVSLGRRWYLVAYDRDRQDWRSFRLDRISDPRPTGQRFRPRDLPGGDALDFVRSPASAGCPSATPSACGSRPPPSACARAVGRWGEVDAAGDDACVLVMNVDELEWPVMVLGQVGAPFTVESPDELRDRVRGDGRALHGGR